VKRIAEFLHARLPKDATKVYITHSPKLIDLIRPDSVIVLKDGRMAAEGDYDLAMKTIEEGFNSLS